MHLFLLKKDNKLSDDIGKSIENTVFLELRRQGKELFYYSDRSSECDFIVSKRDKIIHAIQVTYSLQDIDTKKRELKGLVNACKRFNLNKGTIISYN